MGIIHVLKLQALLAALLLQTVEEPTLQLLTTENYPFNYTSEETGELAGASVDIVKLLMKNVGVSYSITVLPGKRELRIAREKKNVCIFSMDKTPCSLKSLSMGWATGRSRLVLFHHARQ